MNNKKLFLALAAGVAIMAMSSSCATIPKGVKAVKPFNKDKYLGKWYEIARLDFKFKKNIQNVTANYSIKDNGMIRVDNRGFNIVKQEWKESIGKAKFVNQPDEAKLKVSFFGPFYSGYNVIAIDPEYKYALVIGKNLKYMWILSREKTIPEQIKKDYLKKAEAIGYPINDLIWTIQE